MLVPHRYLPPEERKNSAEAFLEAHYPLDHSAATSTIPLKRIPAAHEVTLPSKDLIVLPSDTSNATERPLLATVYQRLQKAVPYCDSSTGDYVTGQPSHFTVLGSADYFHLQEKNKKKGSTTNNKIVIQPTDLYPITIPLEIESSIDEKVWQRPEFDCMEIWGKTFKHYEPMPTRGRWTEHIVQGQYENEWGLQLFGKHRNALKPIAELVSLASKSDDSIERTGKLLYHAITVICWQFYTMERDRWIQVKLEPHEPHYEVRMPSMFMFFLRYDIKKDPYQISAEEWKEATSSNAKLGDLARKYDFVTFFMAVMVHLIPILNRLYFHGSIKFNAARKFAETKLFNNFIQLLHTSHFWTPYIPDYDERCIDSVCTLAKSSELFRGTQWMVRTLSKHFVSMNYNGWFKIDAGTRPQLNNTSKGPDQRNSGVSEAQMLQVRVPFPHCHFHFNAEEAIFLFPEFVDEFPLKLESDAPTIKDVRLQCKMQDIILNQLAKCMDQKTIGECRTVLNQMYKRWRELVVSPNSKPRTKRARKKDNNSNVETAEVVDAEVTMAIPVEWEQEEPEQEEAKVVVRKVARRSALKRTAEEQKQDQEEVLPPARETYNEPINVNLVRARYSYYIDRDAKAVCVGVVPYLNWREHWDIEPETSVNFISNRVWDWLVASGKDAALATLNGAYEIVTMELKQGEQITLNNNEDVLHVYQGVTTNKRTGNRTLKAFRVKLQKTVLIRECTMDFDAVRHYAQFKVHQSGFEAANLNWYVLFYALILLTRSEKKAAALITTEMNSFFGGQPRTNAQVLAKVQQDYNKLRQDIKTSMYEYLKKEPAISALISLALERWDRKTHAIIDAVAWDRRFDSTFVKNYVRKNLPDLTKAKLRRLKRRTVDVYEDVTQTAFEGLNTLIDMLCKHLATPGSRSITLILDVANLQVSLPIKSNQYTPYMNVSEFNLYLINLFEPLLIRLSYVFQHLFPPAVIVDPFGKQHQNITEARNETPVALSLVYSISKQMRSAEFINEVQGQLNAKKAAEAQGKVYKVPELAVMQYSSVLYQMAKMEEFLGKNSMYQTNLNNCSERDRGIESLKANLMELCTDTIYTINQSTVITRSIKLLSNALLMHFKGIEPVLQEIIIHLMTEFTYKEIGTVILRILNEVAQVHPTVRTKIQMFKRSCIEFNPHHHNNNHNDFGNAIKLQLQTSLMEEYQKPSYAIQAAGTTSSSSSNNNNNNAMMLC